MSIDFRLPNINAKTDTEKITQITKYIYQLTEQLNFSFNTIETSIGNPYNVINRNNTASASASEEKKTEEAYSSIKSMIIKSADFIESVSQKVNIELNGSYLAKSEFGDYLEKTKVTIDGNSVGFTELYSYTSGIRSDYGDFDVENKSYIKTGLLYYDNSQPVFGVGIGLLNSSTEFNGHSIIDRNNLSISVTPEKISFWGNDTELAYLTTTDVYFPSAIITAKSGSIAGWKINEGNIEASFSENGNDYLVLISSDLYNNSVEQSTSFYINKNGEPQFYVRPTGFLYAKNAYIEGHIKTSTGSIGKFNINEYGLYAKDGDYDTAHIAPNEIGIINNTFDSDGKLDYADMAGMSNGMFHYARLGNYSTKQTIMKVVIGSFSREVYIDVYNNTIGVRNA